MAALTPANGETNLSPDEATPSDKPKYKSYKKKYLKIRHAFSHKMRESNTLFDDEQRAIKLTQRLQEQNDQLLEMLLDINDSDKLPSYLRYDLRDPVPSESVIPALSPDHNSDEDLSPEQAHRALNEAKADLQENIMAHADYKALEASVSALMDRPKSLTNLSKISHSVLHGEKAVAPADLPTDLTEPSPACYLSPAHEDDFCASIDRYLDTARAGDAPPMPHPAKLTERERERDSQLHNPVSVYNWLAKHRQEFAVEKEEELHKERPIRASEKKKTSPRPPPAPSRGSKRDRASGIKDVKTEPVEEVLDDDGFVIGLRGGDNTPVGNKSKRKRGGEDEAYRPKGGTSRPSKRKRASTIKKGDKEDAAEQEA